MVGGGGNGGSANTVDRQGYNNGRMIAPGTSGGGGGIIWGVLNLEKSSEDKPYIIFVNATESNADSADGSTTTLAYNLGSLP